MHMFSVNYHLATVTSIYKYHRYYNHINTIHEYLLENPSRLIHKLIPIILIIFKQIIFYYSLINQKFPWQQDTSVEMLSLFIKQSSE